MNRKSVSSRFITELLTSGDMNTVIDEGFNDNFLQGIDSRVFRFIRTHYNTYGKVPSIHAFARRFREYPLDKVNGKYGTEEPINYWIDELRTLKKHNEIANMMEKLLPLLEDNEVEDAEKMISNTMTNLLLKYTKQDYMTLQDASKRYASYLVLKEGGGMIGEPTGIEGLDEMTSGAVKGVMTTFMGYTGIGKSWLLVLLAHFFAKELNLRVLFITIETTKELIFRRLDAVWNKFNYTNFTHGLLTAKEEKRYKEYCDKMEDFPASIIVESLVGHGVSAVRAKIIQHSPDVILIDGAYLMADERGEEDNYNGILRVWNDLHKVCIDTNKPMFVTTQSKDETGASIKSLNFAKALSTATDNLISMEQNMQMKLDRELDLVPLKLREGAVQKKYKMQWDFDTMSFGTLFASETKDALSNVINI